jgi:hypothetical protein
MAEKEKTEETPVKETPKEEPKETPTKEASGEPLQEEVVQLREYRRHNRILMSGDASPRQQEESLRYIMKTEGYSPQQVDEYVQQTIGQEEIVPPNKAGQEELIVAPEPKKPETETADTGYNDILARLDRMENQQRKERDERQIEQLENQYTVAVDKVMGGDEVKLLLDKAKDMGQDIEKTRKSIRDNIERSTMTRLRERKTRFPDADITGTWVEEEAKGAVGDTVGLFRSVIGDPSKVSRAPETESGLEGFDPDTPPEVPKVEDGDSTPDVLGKAEEYTTKSLMHMAKSIEQGEESKA